MKKNQKFLFLTFDLEEFDIPLMHGAQLDKEEMCRISYIGLKRILRLVQKHNMKSTFFTTAVFAQHYPKTIKKMTKKHEIALQGYDHSHNYRTMPPKEAIKWIKKSKKFMENLGIKISGFKAPKMLQPSSYVLKRAGIEYDNSLHPTYVPGRYFNIFKPRKPFIENGVKIIPVSTTPFMRLPFSWVWFRNLGLQYAKMCTKFSLLDQNYVNIYVHPYDLVDLNDYDIPWFYKKDSGKVFEKKLKKYILWCRKINLVPTTIRDSISLIFGD